MTGRKLHELLPEQLASGSDLEVGSHYYVKSPVFPWSKFAGVDTVLGPEMKSTGEVMGVAATFGEAFAKAQLSAGQVLPTSGTVFFSVNDHDKAAAIELARRYVHLGFHLVATEGTANVLERAGLTVERVFKVKEGRPNVVDLIKGDRIQLIINTPRGQDTILRRESDSPRRRAGARSDDHHDCRGTGGGGRNRGDAEAARSRCYALQHLHAMNGRIRNETGTRRSRRNGRVLE